jgi:hypothetical protein
MMGSNNRLILEVSKTGKTCPTGEIVGSRNLEEGKIPVMSCEGACIRGEIARLVANEPKVERFITLGGELYLIRYNSKLPVVVYVPEGGR